MRISELELRRDACVAEMRKYQEQAELAATELTRALTKDDVSENDKRHLSGVLRRLDQAQTWADACQVVEKYFT